MVRAGIKGRGQVATPEELSGLKSVFPILYNHREKLMQAALLQGMPSVSAGGNEVTIQFPVIYGFYPKEMTSGDGVATKVTSGPSYALNTNRGIQDKDKDFIESQAFKFGAAVFNEILLVIKEIKLIGKNAKYQRKHSDEDGTIFIEVIIDSITAMSDRVLDIVLNKIRYENSLREKGGGYRWIGLRTGTGSRGVELTTPMRITNQIGGVKDILLWAPVMPLEGSEYITPRKHIAQALICGIIHGFERQTSWNESTAIRAALFQYTFGDITNVEALFGAAARTGIFPRLGTDVKVGRFATRGAWEYLAALALTFKFFKDNYEPSWGDNVGTAKYSFSGGGVATLLEGKIARYIASASNPTSLEERPSPGGIVFFPSTNSPMQDYRLSFVKRAPWAWDNEKRSVTRIVPYEGEIPQSQYNSVETRVSKEGFLIESDDSRGDDHWHPLVFDTIPTLMRYNDYVSAGMFVTRMHIRDTYDPNPTVPSEILNTLLCGWKPAFEPKSILFTDNPVGPSVADFFNFSWKSDFSQFKVKKDNVKGPG